MVNLKLAFLAGVVAAAAIVGVANADPLSGTFNFSIYQGNGSGSASDPEEQATIDNPLIAPGNLIGQGTYTGPINFIDPNVNDINTFLATAGGSFSWTTAVPDNTELSEGSFSLTTVMVITGDVGLDVLSGFISHDDGVSLYDSLGNPLALSPDPTTDIDTLYSGLTGAFTLVYVEANGVPADLVLDVSSRQGVPEPLTLSLFGAGLAGLGAVRRRRKAA